MSKEEVLQQYELYNKELLNYISYGEDYNIPKKSKKVELYLILTKMLDDYKQPNKYSEDERNRTIELLTFITERLKEL